MASESRWKTAEEAKDWPEDFNIIVEETWHPKDEDLADLTEGDWRTLFYSKKSSKNIDRAEEMGPEFTFRYLLESDLYPPPAQPEAESVPAVELLKLANYWLKEHYDAEGYTNEEVSTLIDAITAYVETITPPGRG